MAIQIGEKIPSVKLTTVTSGGPRPVTTDEVFGGKKVVLFAVPGAFTPTCSEQHLPSFVQHADEILGKGVDAIACLSVNDAFVMSAWAKAGAAGEKIQMLADGNGDLVKALGLELDASSFGMGTRAQRFSMIVEDGVVKALNVEKGAGFEVSGADTILGQL